MQPIFLGGKLIAAHKYSENESRVSQIELKAVKDEVINETISAYLKLILVSEIIKSDQTRGQPQLCTMKKPGNSLAPA